MTELIPYAQAQKELQSKAARLAMALIVAGKKNTDIVSSVEGSFGITLSMPNINSLRRRDDVKAAIVSNDREALQVGIATRARRIEMLEEGMELLSATFVYTDFDGTRKLRTTGDGIKGQDAVAAVKAMTEIVKVASEIMEPRQGGTTNVQVNNGGQVANFGSLIGLSPDTDVLGMLRNAAAAIEERVKDSEEDNSGVIDVPFTEEPE